MKCKMQHHSYDNSDVCIIVDRFHGNHRNNNNNNNINNLR